MIRLHCPQGLLDEGLCAQFLLFGLHDIDLFPTGLKELPVGVRLVYLSFVFVAFD